MVHASVWLGDGGVCHGDLVEFLLLQLLTNCLTIHLNAILCAIYYTRKGVGSGFDALGLFFENLIKLWTLGMKYLSAFVIAKLPTLWKVVGLLITLLVLNILAFIYLRVADIIIKLCKICKWICGLPLISVIAGFFKCMYSFFVSIPEKVEKEEKKEKERKEKQANAVLGLSSWLLKEIDERLAEAKKALETREEVEKEERKKIQFLVLVVGTRDMMSQCANIDISYIRRVELSPRPHGS